jgi:protein AroM
MTTVGLITVGQSPRSDVVPDMAAILGGDVEIIEAGALDGLAREQIVPLAPEGDDEILVTRLTDGSSVFVGKSKVIPRIEARIAALEDRGVALNVLLCTGEFPSSRRGRSRAAAALAGLLRAMFPAPRRAPVRAPRAADHRAVGPRLDAPWPRCRLRENDPPVRRAATLRAGNAGLWSWTARLPRKTRDEIASSPAR